MCDLLCVFCRFILFSEACYEYSYAIPYALVFDKPNKLIAKQNIKLRFLDSIALKFSLPHYLSLCILYYLFQ